MSVCCVAWVGPQAVILLHFPSAAPPLECLRGKTKYFSAETVLRPSCCFSVLLTGADLNLAYGRRYGLVGRNGLGKTTLLKMIASRNLRIPSHISILHVEQEVAGDDTPALQSVLECDTTRESLLTEEKELTARVNSGR